jgi:predicted nucleic acid-binding protein
MTWKPVSLDMDVVEAALGIEERWSLSFWDSLIVAAAQSAGCTHLVSEDLQAGQMFEDLLVVDPFVTDPESIL